MAELVFIRDLADSLAVRKMCGRALRADRKPITRHTLIRWRSHGTFPRPLPTPYVTTCELWDRRAVRQWIRDHGDFTIPDRGGPQRL
jgi:hypothetical protein